LISTSGVTQVALGATTAHLNEWINARLTVLSISGTFEGSAGFNAADRVYHLQGDRNWVADTLEVDVGSPVNQARRQGRYTVCIIGSYEHTGAEVISVTPFYPMAYLTLSRLLSKSINCRSGLSTNL
jgi:hypothetical protein